MSTGTLWGDDKPEALPRAGVRPVYEYTFSRRRVAEVPATVRTPRDTLPVIAALLEGRETEGLMVVLLDTRNNVIATELVYAGNVSAALVRVGELFRAAVRMNAKGLIIAHNHPSGDPAPSADDVHLTSECIAAGRLLDIDVLDHIVYADGGSYHSMQSSGAVTFARR